MYAYVRYGVAPHCPRSLQWTSIGGYLGLPLKNYEKFQKKSVIQWSNGMGMPIFGRTSLVYTYIRYVVPPRGLWSSQDSV